MTDHLQLWPPSDPPRSNSVLQRVSGFVRQLAVVAMHRHRERRAAAQLRGLDDRALKDMGIGRSEIAQAVRQHAGGRARS
jgi:uncharacterized protein YjiS (DUF1127 family)